MLRRAPLKRSTPLKRHTRLRPRSERMEALYEVRRPIVGDIVGNAIYCAVPWCYETVLGPHEPQSRGRGGSIVDPENIVAMCWFHNSHIAAEEPAWAYELGLHKHSWDETA